MWKKRLFSYLFYTQGLRQKALLNDPGLDMSKVKPLYKSMKRLEDNLANGEVGENLKAYIDLIEETVGVPVSLLAYGPERSQLLEVKSL